MKKYIYGIVAAASISLTCIASANPNLRAEKILEAAKSESVHGVTDTRMLGEGLAAITYKGRLHLVAGGLDDYRDKTGKKVGDVSILSFCLVCSELDADKRTITAAKFKVLQDKTLGKTMEKNYFLDKVTLENDGKLVSFWCSLIVNSTLAKDGSEPKLLEKVFSSSDHLLSLLKEAKVVKDNF